MRCYCGPADDESLNRLVTDDKLTPGDADAIRDFRQFLTVVASGDKTAIRAAVRQAMGEQ
jgi:hypothetical protein